MSPHTVSQLIEGFKAGKIRSLSKLISLVEDQAELISQVIKELPPPPQSAHVIGITGAPGSGKSSLVTVLIEHMRKRDEKVAVIAVDPSSPFVGGALLGDRIRMASHNADPGVYIRSMASRGALGGLSRATWQASRILEHFGFHWIIIETVGVGQSEVDIARLADSTVLVLVPGLGDEIQILKAGIMEIGDIIAINKADKPGADRTKRDVEMFIEHYKQNVPQPPKVLSTVATSQTGSEKLYEALRTRKAQFEASSQLLESRKNRLLAEITSILSNRVVSQAQALLSEKQDYLDAGDILAADSFKIADRLYNDIMHKHDRSE